MRVDLADEMRDSRPHYSLIVDGELWQVYIFGVSRLAESWLVQLALVGSDIRTATVHVAARRRCATAARDVVNLVREWLQSNDRSTHRFLEFSDGEPRPVM